MKDQSVPRCAELIDKIRANLCEFYDANPVCERCSIVCPYDQVLERLEGVIEEIKE